MELKINNDPSCLADLFTVNERLTIEILDYIFYCKMTCDTYTQLIQKVYDHFSPKFTDTQMAYVFCKIGVIQYLQDSLHEQQEDKEDLDFLEMSKN